MSYSNDLSNNVDVEYIFNIEDVRFILVSTIVKKKDKKIFSGMASKGIKYFSPMHTHGFFELFYQESGNSEIEFDSEIRDVHTGNVLCVTPYTRHRVSQYHNSKSLTIAFSIEKNNVFSNSPIYDKLANLLSIPYVYFKASNEFANSFKCVWNFQDNIEPETNTKIDINVLKQLHNFVFDFLDQLSFFMPALSYNGLLIANNSITKHRKVSRFINTHFKDNITIKDIADILHLSERQTIRIIKSYYGCTLKELLQSLRLATAAELLTSTNNSIENIIDYVGYSSASGFFSAFKSHYGCSPSKYRKMHFPDKPHI